MVTVEPLSRTSLSDRVAYEIRRQIWAGELRGGDRLGQAELAAAMGVSRIPVREALIALAHEGVVRMATHRGAFVEPLDRAGVTDHYDLFAHIDGFALGKAVQRASSDDRTALAARMEAARSIEPPRVMQPLVVEIRTRFHELGGSPRFRAVARGLAGLVPGNFFEEVPGSVAVAGRHLPQIGGAVRTLDAAGAVEAYAAMIRAHGALVLDVLESRGLLD